LINSEEDLKKIKKEKEENTIEEDSIALSAEENKKTKNPDIDKPKKKGMKKAKENEIISFPQNNVFSLFLNIYYCKGK
jgi:hypothetical protein